MRLTCPNCDAQYEVSDSVIPLHGRDVQCSNCGQTWFQTHSSAEPHPAEDEDDVPPGDDALPEVAAGSWVDAAADPASGQSGQDVAGASLPGVPDFGEIPGHDALLADPAPVAAAGFAAAGFSAADFVSLPDDTTSKGAQVAAPADRFADDYFAEQPRGEGVTEAAALPVAEPKRRSLDEAVLTVLREEADREARARKAAGGVETQTDLNLSQQAGAGRPAPPVASLPKLRVQSVAESRPGDMLSTGPRRPVEDLSTPFEPEDPASEPEEPVSAARQSRRNLLPDIEEINSSLQAEGAKGRASPDMNPSSSSGQEQRGGFRTGFLLVVVLAAAVIGLYAAAPSLGIRFPAAAPVLNAFVATVDRGRVAIDALMQKSLDSLNSGDKPAP